MIIQIILAIIGMLGTCYWRNYIAHDRYTYTMPFTDHEMTILFLLMVCIVVMVSSILSIVLSIVKSKNEDRLFMLNNTVCPQCGLNIVKGTEKCPKCGNNLKSGGE